ASGTYNNKNVTVSSSGATDATQAVSGATYAAPTVSGSPVSVTVTEGASPSVDVSDYVTGVSSYELTTNPGGAGSLSGSTVTFNTTGKAADVYTFVVTVKNAAGDAAGTATFTWNVTVNARPTLSVSKATARSTATYNGAGDEDSFTVSGANLTTTVTVDVGSGSVFEVSKSSGSGYARSVTFTASEVNSGAQTVYVRLKAGTALGKDKSGTVTVSSTGVSSSPTVTLSGDVNLGTPNVTLASGANSQLRLVWDAVTGATGYKVNVCEVASAGASSAGRGAGEPGVSARARDARDVETYSGTFEEITSDSEIVEGGYYIIVRRTDCNAANGTTSSSALTSTDLTSYMANGKIVNPPKAVVWTLENPTHNESGFYVKNIGENKYVTSAASDASNLGNISMQSTAVESRSAWVITHQSGGWWRINSVEISARSLFTTTAATPKWKNYANTNEEGSDANNTYKSPKIYKKTSSCLLTDEPVSGTSVTLTTSSSPAAVVVGKTYSWDVKAVSSSPLAESGVASSSDPGKSTITVSSGPSVGVSAEDYILAATYGHAGVPLALTVTGQNLEGNVTVEVPAGSDFELCATENGTYSRTVTLTQSAGAVDGTVYLRLKNGLSVGDSYYETVTVSSANATDATLDVAGAVYPMPAVSQGSLHSYVLDGTDIYLDFSDYHTTDSSFTYSVAVSPAATLTEDTDYMFDAGSGIAGQASSGPGDIWFAETTGRSVGDYTFTVTVA
ncbi:MAG: hypothetical protein J6Y19_09185, partial [Kiritimatiellae bacterium]|nr:hypothetical protein [Kiritimatiellia bacterium]